MVSKQIILSFLLGVVLLIALSCADSRSQDIKSIEQLEKTEVEILSLLAPSDTAELYNLTFGSISDTTYQVTMAVGKYEAQTLAVSLENLTPTAPLPLDVLQEAITKFGFKVQEIVIDSLNGGIYTAKIVCMNKTSTIELKSRPIDATTIAVKSKAQIFVNAAFLKRRL